MARPRKIKWLDEPEAKDHLAARSFLSMVLAPGALDETTEELRSAPAGEWAAKDILRAAGLAPLRAKRSEEVAEKLEKIKHGIPISPVLLVGGIRDDLVIADGYHRACAVYSIDQGALVPGRLLWRT